MRQALKNRTRVLVVEDHPMVREGLRNLFEARGYASVITADDGATAFQLMHQEHIDAVVTDTQMPRMSGIELTRRIRADKTLPQPVIIGISANGSPSLASEYKEAGADKFLPKGTPGLPELAEALLVQRFENN